MKEKTFDIKTFGCKVNYLDSENIKNLLSKNGYRQVLQNPDILIVNTCTVTEKADKKGLHFIRNWQKKNPKSNIYITGCGTRKNNPYIKLKSKNIFIASYIKDLKLNLNLSKTQDKILPSFSRTRQYIKIQDGCDNFCSYCIVPFTRGKSRYRDIDDIIKEIKYYEKKGVKEIVLTGINIGGYGTSNTRNYKETKLAHLLENILDKTSIPRIRLSSIGPNYINSKFLNIFKNKRICPHIHLSIQSGSDKILKMQNRDYTSKYIKKICTKLYNIRPNIAITTDIIVGLPEETEKDFKDTINLLKDICISKIHIFPYSKRKGTKSYQLENQIPSKIIKDRILYMRELNKKFMLDFYKKNLNKPLNILIETIKDKYFLGYSENYIPVWIHTNNFKKEKSKIINTIHTFSFDKIKNGIKNDYFIKK